MKTDILTVSSNGSHVEEALILADKVAAFKDLPRRSALHLRLLTEEAMGMLRSITEDMNGEFWIEDANGVYELHLRVETLMDEHKREQLLAASTTGVNEAERGIMGRIRAFFEPTDGLPMYYVSPVLSDMPPMHTGLVWSMMDYRSQVDLGVSQNRAGAREAWDELERSVVAHVADDVKVSIRGRTVEMTIVKKLGN